MGKKHADSKLEGVNISALLSLQPLITVRMKYGTITSR